MLPFQGWDEKGKITRSVTIFLRPEKARGDNPDCIDLFTP